MNIRLKILRPSATLPSYGTDGAAGFDLYAAEGAVIMHADCVMVRTGIAVEVPDGWCLKIYARSGLATKQGLAPANMVGVVDSDYRGEVVVALRNYGLITREVKVGDRIAQAMLERVQRVSFSVVDELSQTARGEGGFGSTGR